MPTDDELKLLRIKTSNKEELKQKTSKHQRDSSWRNWNLKYCQIRRGIITKSEFHTINNSSNIIIFLFAKSAHPTSSEILITLYSRIQNSSSILFKCADLGQERLTLKKEEKANIQL